ncbi:glycosyltransferase [Runella sp.]|uniref:glycosyltransferase n=1 Tax=Runella sp. TaxID=1960881 RepID=UPI003D0D48B7
MAAEKISKPLISVIIPVYNGVRFIKDAIESVLSQGYDPVQLIMIDGGSTDGTLDLVRSYGDKIELIHQQSKGLALARNESLLFVKGEFMVYLDSDDLLAPLSFARIMDVFEHYPDTEFAFGKVQHFFEENTAKDLSNNDITTSPVMGAGLFRTSAVQRIGNFIPALNPCEDIEWLHRVKKQMKIRIIEGVTLHKRRHDANLTNDIPVIYTQLVRSLKMVIDRERYVKS